MQNITRSITLNGLSVTATLPVKVTSQDESDLPDGSWFPSTVFRPGLRRNLNSRTSAIRIAKYLGSVPVHCSEVNKNTEYLNRQIDQLRSESTRLKPVLLVISLAGIKVCSPDGKSVYMAHALKRISYATSDPNQLQFCFVARQPKGHFSQQFCHTFLTKTAEQAEELNSIVGNAFRMAYAAQLQRQPSFHEVIANQLQDKSSMDPTQRITWTSPLECSVKAPPTMRVPPTCIPGLKTFSSISNSHQSSPSSDDSPSQSSPSELNSLKKLIDKPPLIKRLGLGLSKENTPEDESYPLMDACKQTLDCNNRLSQSSSNTSASSDQDFKDKRTSHISSSGSSNIPTPPPLPERSDSLSKEEGELRTAPWFQAGIPREITLEVLSQEPVGAFMVRESTTKPGCFALSLRVPKEFHHLGIAHYLILRTAKGYKIKGFTKEFSSLTSLITHHSVMPELLPCTLSLHRYNPNFEKSDSSKDFADINTDPDYNTLVDFRKLMAEIKL
ncbi:hypothetical protein M8J75_005327 [Diaphorina citri]|nr:hypothetical protein M8J75_005327 [Diaphorina citri]